jgi:hypothetical protein
VNRWVRARTIRMWQAWGCGPSSCRCIASARAAMATSIRSFRTQGTRSWCGLQSSMLWGWAQRTWIHTHPRWDNPCADFVPSHLHMTHILHGSSHLHLTVASQRVWFKVLSNSFFRPVLPWFGCHPSFQPCPSPMRLVRLIGHLHWCVVLRIWSPLQSTEKISVQL